MSGCETTRLGPYELLRRVARGGMADIYLARRLDTEQHVALKVLNDERSNDPEARALFLDEARLLAMMSHHNLAQVFDVDHQDDVHYLAMEYVDGADLRDILNTARSLGKAIPFAAALSILAAAAAGLDHAHRRCGPDGRPLRLVHRDVSLSNIMVGHDGSVKVVDFGIARATVSSVHTQPGIVRGKASYMAPEQCLGDGTDLRTDVFALGVVFYELTTGQRCFQGNSDFERMLAVVRGDFVPPSVHVPGYPPALEALVKIALAQNPGNRFSSAAAMIEAIEDISATLGLTLGTHVIAGVMRDLFQPAEPEVTKPTVVITKPRRMARGTDSESTAQDEDRTGRAPPLGRRSVPAASRSIEIAA